MWLVKVAQSCPTLCNPMDYTVHGILQARILEWVAFPFSRVSSQTQWNSGFPHCRQILYQLSHQGSPRILEWVAYPFSSGSSWPRNWAGSPALQADSLPAEPPGKPIYVVKQILNLKWIINYFFSESYCTHSWYLTSQPAIVPTYLICDYCSSTFLVGRPWALCCTNK